MEGILIVDDEMIVRSVLTDIIMSNSEYGFDIAEASSVMEAKSLCAENRYDLIFLDHSLGDGIGWELAERIYRDPHKYGSPKMIAMSGSVLPEDYAGKKYYTQFISKPFEIAQVVEILKKLK